MRQRDYVDFDLAIEDVGSGHFRVTVIDSPTGQARGEFDMPFSDLEMENFLLKIGRPRSGVRRLESPETEFARTFGSRLFDAVFTGDVGRQWIRSLDAAEREERGLRLRLRLSDAPVLSDVPWEYLYSPAADDFVVLSSWTPVVRYISLDRGAPPLTVVPPLRMLAMVSSPSDYPPLDTEAEFARLDEGMAEIVESGLVVVERLEKATLRELQRAVRRSDIHIFHFIGHGGFDEAAGDGVLLLETDEGRSREVSGRQLGTIIDDARTIRLAVLNACEGARATGSDPFAGVAQSLVAKGIPAVVAMQFEISDRAAIIFAHEFYSAITDGMSVEAATGEARRAIFGSKADVEWGTPVLYMRAEDGRLFDVAAVEPVVEANDDIAAPVVEPDLPIEPDMAGDPTVETETVPEPDLVADVGVAADEADVVAEVDIVTEDHLVGGTEEVGRANVDTDAIPAAYADDLVRGGDEETDVETGVGLEPGGLDEAERDDEWHHDVPPVPILRRVAAVLGSVAAIVMVVVLAISFAGDGEETATTTQPDGETVVQNGPSIEHSAEVEAFRADGIAIDGDMSEWLELPKSFALYEPISDEVIRKNEPIRLGDNSVGRVGVAYDDEFLYVGVVVEDDVYSQPNEGNQIWRGDAFNMNLVRGDVEVPQAPDAHTFQLTMAPRSDVTNAEEAVLFWGTGSSFGKNNVDEGVDLPVDIAGVVEGNQWGLEARVPWSVFGMSGPPLDGLDAVFFAAFDNDGERDGSGWVQAEILTNLPDVFFKQPATWGTLTLSD